MRKKILVAILFGFFLLGITGCTSTNNFDIGGASDIEINDNNGVTLSIKDGTLKNTCATLILENNTNKLLHYDEYYKIEVKKDNIWHTINVDLYFNDPLWEVKQNSNEEIDLNWKDGYGKLASGEYRIIKKVYFENEKEQEFYVSVEFVIK